MGKFKQINEIDFSDYGSVDDYFDKYIEDKKDVIKDTVDHRKSGAGFPPSLVGIDWEDGHIGHFPLMDFICPEQQIYYPFLVNSLMYLYEREEWMRQKTSIDASRASHVIDNPKRSESFFKKHFCSFDMTLKDLAFSCARHLLDEENMKASIESYDVDVLPDSYFDDLDINFDGISTRFRKPKFIVFLLEDRDENESNIRILPVEDRQNAVAFGRPRDRKGNIRLIRKKILR